MAVVILILMAFAASLFAPLALRSVGRTASLVLTTLPIVMFTLSVLQLNEIITGSVLAVSIPWVPNLGLDLSFRLDGLSQLFVLLINGIGALVVMFSFGYLKGEPNKGRFFGLLFLFMGSMLGLVAADNLVLLFIFWELTSLSSFFLIGFHHDSSQSRTAALQALLVTGAGGLMLLAGFLMLMQITGTSRISDILLQRDVIQNSPLYAPSLILIMIGAFTKSAQVPFHFWLPNAMVAPTPVSAFLHSATMVKAGVYLLARFLPVYGNSELWLAGLVIVGVLTATVGPLLALKQTDLKKLLAYSTVGSLGMLFVLLGLGTVEAVNAAIVYLLVHSLYKGSLFMVAGTVDHEAGTRDVVGLSGLWRYMPITAIAGALAALSMAGFPPLLGFIGKELLYNAKLESTDAGWIIYFLSIGSNMVTVAVAFIVGMEPFFGRQLKASKHPHEGSILLWVGPLALASLGLVIGLVPGNAGRPLLSAAASAVSGAPQTVSLEAWHGFNIVLAMSVVTLIGGIGIFLLRERIRYWVNKIPPLTRYGPEKVYFLLLSGLNQIARYQTRIIQNGSLSRYVSTLILSTAALLLYVFSDSASVSFSGLGETVRFGDLVLSLVLLSAVLCVAFSRSRFLAVTCVGFIGFNIALLYAIYSAPDLAITQVLVETLSVVLMVFLISKLPTIHDFSVRAVKLGRALMAATGGILFGGLTWLSINSQSERDSISNYFTENSVADAHGKNVVNVILVDFRAIDTLGEITVLAVAAVGVITLLRRTAFPTREEFSK